MANKINKIIRHIQLYYWGRPSAKKFFPGIAWFFILLYLICLPGDNLPKTEDWLNKIFFDKWVHIGLFGLLSILFIAPVFGSGLPLKRKWIYVILIAFAIIGWGFVTELIQHNYVQGRSFDLFDWVADTCGTILAVFLSKYFFLDQRKHSKITAK